MRVRRWIGVPVLSVLVLAGCTLAPAVTPGLSVAPSPALAACDVVLGDGTRPSSAPVPSALPSGAPADLLPSTAAVFVFVGPGDPSPDPVFLVGPSGGRCEASIGTGAVVLVRDAGGEVVLTFEAGGGVDPAACRGSRYLEAAHRACEAATGASLPPAAATALPGETVSVIPTGVAGLSVAVVAGDPGTATAWAALFGFRTVSGGTDSWSARCEIHAPGPGTCAAALAFVAGGGSDLARAVAAMVGAMGAPY